MDQLLGLTGLTLFPVLVVVGWMTSKRTGATAARLAQGLLATLLAVAITLAITGVFHGRSNFGDVHRFGGHGMVVVAWLGIPFSMGTVLQLHSRKRFVHGLAQSAMLLVLLMLVLLCSLTGYLGPSHSDAEGVDDEGRQNRFVRRMHDGCRSQCTLGRRHDFTGVRVR